jgi:hypothetical protein
MKVSICIDVGDCGKYSKYFATLGKLPTDFVSSIWTSAIVANALNILQLSIKYQRTLFVCIDDDDCGKYSNSIKY